MTISRVKPADWGTGEKLTSAQMNDVDKNTSYALDKRSGQTDTLASDVTVTGETTFEAPATFVADVTAATLSADVLLIDDARVQGAGSKIQTLTGGRIELGDDDYPGLAAGHAGRTVVRYVAPINLRGITSSVYLANGTGSTFYDYPSTSHFLPASSGLLAEFASVDTGNSTASRALLYHLDPWLQDGATLSEVSVKIQGESGHAGLPALMPRVRVQRVSAAALGASSALHSSGTHVVDTAASTAAYQSAHAITATCDLNNVIDKGTYSYQLLIWNEGGTNALSGLDVQPIKITQTITDLRPH